MITSLLLVASLVGDTTVTVTESSRDMHIGRDKLNFTLTSLAVRMECKKFVIKGYDLKVDGHLYVWTGSLVCTR